MTLESICEHSALVVEDELWQSLSSNSDMGPASGKGISQSIALRNQAPMWLDMSTAPKGLTEGERQEIVRAILPSKLRPQTVSQRSSMTVAQFVELKFIPEHVEFATLSGRIHYQSMLKYVVHPETIDRIFQAYTVNRRTRLRPIADWPYLGDLPLCDVRPETVQNLTSFALRQGYSIRTAAQIRKIVSTVFDYAKGECYFDGENPAKPSQSLNLSGNESPHLPHPEIVRLVSQMSYPMGEMILIAMFLGMSAGEICGLQWRRVNLAEKKISRSDGEVIPAMSVIVREEVVRNQLIAVARERKLNRTIPKALLPIFRELKCRDEFTGLNDFVLVSHRGKPITPSNILTGRLRSIAKEMNIPSLSCPLVHSTFSHDLESGAEWGRMVETELPY